MILAIKAITVFLCFSLFTPGLERPRVPKVTIKNEGGRYQLYRDDKPYFIKGAGGYQHFEKIRAYGGNSIRIWSTKGAKVVMDKAQELGLTVTLGLDLGQERLGFNYSDKKAVREQFERLKKDILEFKDHPALLMWGVGNEIEQFSNNYEVWNAVNEIVNYIHQVDPRHPATTMLAGVPRKHIAEIVKRCPKLDLLSINIFKLITTVAADIRSAGWQGPFLVSEWGATGYWESEMTPWNTFVEETSTQKTEAMALRYKQGILGNRDRCVGGYVFYWGWKQARTHTLLSLFSEDSLEYGMIDLMHRNWTGREKANKAPRISPIRMDKQETNWSYTRPGSSHSCMVSASDPEGDALRYSWEVYPESEDRKEGGDEESKPAPLTDLKITSRNEVMQFRAPVKAGAYRVFVYVKDGKGHIASSNHPFFVR